MICIWSVNDMYMICIWYVYDIRCIMDDYGWLWMYMICMNDDWWLMYDHSPITFDRRSKISKARKDPKASKGSKGVQRVQRLVNFNHLQSLGTFIALPTSLSLSLSLGSTRWNILDSLGCTAKAISKVACSIIRTPKYRNRYRPNGNCWIPTNASKFRTRMILRTHGLNGHIDRTSYIWRWMCTSSNPKKPSYFEVHQEIQCVTRSKYLTLTHSEDGFQSLPSLRSFLCVTAF